MVSKCNSSFGLSQEPSSVEKIMEIDEHIGCAMSGLTADARTLVEHGRVETQVVIFLVHSY
jgi:20S proteasome alpha/beta subunit